MFANLLIYGILIIAGLIIPLIVGIHSLFCIIVDFTGAPFVGTDSKIIDEILQQADIKKGQQFLELGSGDGRVVRRAVKKYGVYGTGIDLHIPLIIYSRLQAKLSGLRNIEFKVANFFKTDLSQADVIFVFLLPKTLEKLKPKLLGETKKNTLIISHGFKIAGMEKNLVKKIDRKIFPTYYYYKV